MTSTKLPKIAPHESCIVCLKGDTTTGLVFSGPAEWAIAGLEVLGVPGDQARATVEHFANVELGCESGMVPDDSFDYAVRVCRQCVENADASFPIGELPNLPAISPQGK